MPDTSMALTIMRVSRKGTCAARGAGRAPVGAGLGVQRCGGSGRHAPLDTCWPHSQWLWAPQQQPVPGCMKLSASYAAGPGRALSLGTSRGAGWPRSSRQNRYAAACLAGAGQGSRADVGGRCTAHWAGLPDDPTSQPLALRRRPGLLQALTSAGPLPLSRTTTYTPPSPAPPTRVSVEHEVGGVPVSQPQDVPHHGHDRRGARVVRALVQPHLAAARLEPQHLVQILAWQAGEQVWDGG